MSTKVTIGTAFALLAMGLTLAADDTPDEAVKKELAKLEGTWALVSVVTNGTQAPEEGLKGRSVVFKGDKMTNAGGRGEAKWTFKLDPAKKPAAIDLTPDEDGPDRGKTYQGIYKLEGDTLTICFSPPDQGRPAEFASRKATVAELIVLKRQKS